MTNKRARFQSIPDFGENSNFEGKQKLIFCDDEREFKVCLKILDLNGYSLDIYKIFGIYTNKPEDATRFLITDQEYLAIKNFPKEVRNLFSDEMYEKYTFNEFINTPGVRAWHKAYMKNWRKRNRLD